MNWNAGLYDQKHAFIYQYGKSVLDLLNPKVGETFLDIGCGTGYLTDQIRLRGAQVLGTDPSKQMIEKAIAMYPETTFRIVGAEDLDFDKRFDAVFSNATLHWIKDHPLILKNIFRSLKPGGRFVAEMGGKGNIQQLQNILRKVLLKHGFTKQAETQVWYFPSLATYSTLLENAGFRVTGAVHFDRDTKLEDSEDGIKKWLYMFGEDFFYHIPPDQKEIIILEVRESLRPSYLKEGNWYADYKRLRFTAIKE